VKHLAVLKIKKLLRLAQADGPEGANALLRAQEHMERHGIRQEELEDAEVVRTPVPDVAGTYWKEQLLVTIAEAHRCVVIESAKGARTMALRGGKNDVARALAVYEASVLELAAACAASWRCHIVYGSNYNRADTERMWHRVFHLAAVDAAVTRIAAARQAPVRVPEAASTPAAEQLEEPVEGPVRERPDRVAEERRQSEDDLADLMEELGDLEARYVQRLAWGQGAAAGEQIDIVSNRHVSLAAASSVG
jgi:hypothetical protein